MRKLFLIILILMSYRLSLAEDIVVSAAYAYKTPISEIISLYKSKTGRNVVINMGTSVHLMNQIRAEAAVDVFLSAGIKEIEELLKEGLIIKSSYHTFLSSGLSVAVNKKHKRIDKISHLRELISPDFKTIAVGNPRTMPLGRYTEEVINFYQLNEKLRDKFIYVENFQQAIDYLVRQEVDAAIIFSHELVARKEQITEILSIDEKSHSPILFAIAITSYSKNKSLANDFLKFMISQEAAEIFKKYGFRLIKGRVYEPYK